MEAGVHDALVNEANRFRRRGVRREALAEEHAAQEHAEREDVAARTGRLAARDFRGGPFEAREAAGRSLHRRAEHRLPHAEALQLHLAAPRDEHVARGEAAVDEVGGRAVGKAAAQGGVEALGHLEGDQDGDVVRQLAILALVTVDEHLEGAAVDELGDDERLAHCGELEVVDLHDARVAYARRRGGRADDAGHHALVVVARELLEDLHRDEPSRAAARNRSGVHGAEAPAPDLAGERDVAIARQAKLANERQGGWGALHRGTRMYCNPRTSGMAPANGHLWWKITF